MAVIDAMFTGPENVLAAFNRHENPVFSVWQGKDLIFSHNAEDTEAAERLLSENLDALAETQNRSIFKIKFHPAVVPNYITDKSPVCGSFTFRVAEWNPGGMRPDGSLIPHPANSYSGAIMEKLNKIAETQNSLESRLSAIEEEEEEEEKGILGAVENYSEVFNKLCQNPVILNLITRLLGNVKPEPVTAAALAGVDDDAKLTAAINKLKAADPQLADDLTKLSVIAEQNPQQFNFLLSTLRSMVK